MAEVLLNDGCDDFETDCISMDAELSAIQKFEKYMESEHSYNRQMVVRGVVDTLQHVLESRNEVERVFAGIVKLSNDSDDMIRIEMIEHVPLVAEFSLRHNLYSDVNLVLSHLLPIIVQYLSDPNSQARKAGHSSLLQMVNCKLLPHDDIETLIVPAVISMADPESIDDFRTDAVTLMSRMAPMVGKDMTERLFLTRFSQMCSDALFHVRKVCAANFGEMCQVVGQQSTENCLLPKFYYLCEDGVWGVRNACAECFVQVSKICSSQVRREELTPLFISLLCDQSRWVRLAAFQALGGFISTFADSQQTGLELTLDGRVVYTSIFHCNSEKVPDNPAEQENLSIHMDTEKDYENVPSVSSTQSAEELHAQGYINDDKVDSFDAFHFWRVAPMLVDQSSILAACGDIACLNMLDQLSVSKYTPSDLTPCLTEGEKQSCYCNEKSSSHNVYSSEDSCYLSDLSSMANNMSPIFTQSIVPSALLSHFMSMIEPARAQTIDPEIMRQCAFSFPAVAFTLGRLNWICIRDLYRTLAKDMQWKVRRTLAFSIHQLAAVLGEELTTADLLPIFDEFIKDLDEVRIGVLKHLADFLKILHVDVRNSYLKKLPEFLKIDNCRNWRFRQELAEQLRLLVELFPHNEIYNYIRPLALLLSDDHVAEIRRSSLKAISSILGRLRTQNSFCLEFIEELKDRFGNHKQSSRRQMFLLLCCYIMKDNSVEVEFFATHLLPAALAKYSDPVPNTRLGLARLLDRYVLTNSFLNDSTAVHYPQLLESVDALKNDSDRDVRCSLTNGRICSI